MRKSEKFFPKYCNSKRPETKEIFHVEFKSIKNPIRYETRKFKNNQYETYFEINENVTTKIWKGIKSLIILKFTNRRYPNITSINETLPMHLANISLILDLLY